MMIDEAIKKLLNEAEQQDRCADNYIRMDYYSEATPPEVRRQRAKECRQLAEWLSDYKNLREENKVLTQECDRLIKEKGELLKKSEQIEEYKRLLKLAVEDIHELLRDKRNLDGNGQSCNICSYIEWCPCCKECTIREDLRNWRYAAEALKLLGGE